MNGRVLATKGILGDDHSRATKGIIYNRHLVFEAVPQPQPIGAHGYGAGGAKGGYEKYEAFKRINEYYKILGSKKFDVDIDLDVFISEYILSQEYDLTGLKKFDFYNELSVQGKRDITNILFALGMLE